MLPLPSLSFSGGAGGDAETGDQATNNGLSTGFGGFNVGGKGSNVTGGTASAAPSSGSNTLVYIALGLAGVGILVTLLRR